MEVVLLCTNVQEIVTAVVQTGFAVISNGQRSKSCHDGEGEYGELDHDVGNIDTGIKSESRLLYLVLVETRTAVCYESTMR